MKGGRDMSLKRILSFVIPAVGTIIGAVLTGICEYEEHMNNNISDDSQNNEKEAEETVSLNF